MEIILTKISPSLLMQYPAEKLPAVWTAMPIRHDYGSRWDRHFNLAKSDKLRDFLLRDMKLLYLREREAN